jgi:tartrate-resistant acid phosphatase type 5
MAAGADRPHRGSKLKPVAVLLLLAACTAGTGATVRTSSPPPPSPSRSVAATAPFVFAVKGDWGAGTAAQREVTDAMCALRRTLTFKYIVTTGDNFYNPDGNATQRNYYGPERCLYTYPGNVWRAVWGNHDVGGPSTATVLGSPNRYYTWSVGTTQFFMLDANEPGSAVQRSWLERALRTSSARVKIVAFHQPAFTSGIHTDNTSAQRNWVPLFVRYHVALVLTGHNHDYEHLKEDGIDYVVSGGGGQTAYPCLRVEPGALRCVSAYHFLIVTVHTDSVSVRAVRATGGELDDFEIKVPGDGP